MLGGSTMSVVRVTAVASPLSLGTRLDYHAADGVLVVQNEVKIREVNGQALKVNSYYVGFFSGYTSAGQPVFLVSVSSASTSSGSGTSGSSGECFDVIQSIDCTDGELSVTYATICPDSGTAIIVGQQTGNYSITTRYSITGGATLAAGVTLNLVGDVASPGNSKVYGTNDSGVRGWQDSLTSLTDLIGFPDTYTAGYLVRVNEAGDGLEFYNDPYALQIDLDTTNDTIAALQGDLADLVSAVESIPGPPDLSSIYSRLTALETDLATAQGDITTLQTDLGTVQTDITTLQSDLTTANGSISTLQGDLTTANGSITTLQGELASLSAAVAAIPGPPDLSSIYSRLSALEGA